MQVFYLKSRSRNFAVPPGEDRYSVEYYGCFLVRSNANEACKLLQRINANTGRYYDTVEVVSRVPSGSRCLTWQEWLANFRGDGRPYARLDGNIAVDIERQESLIRTQDMKGMGIDSE